ncbi:hypothetical protein BDR26DRAFT_870067, partial [Obelidium mucronatum]
SLSLDPSFGDPNTFTSLEPKGFEKWFAPAETAVRIVWTTADHVVAAWAAVLRRHPRMRLVHTVPSGSEQESVDQLANKSVEIKSVPMSSPLDGNPFGRGGTRESDLWKQYVDEAIAIRRRVGSIYFKLDILIPQEPNSNFALLVLSGEHIVADGFSGARITHDFLTHLSSSTSANHGTTLTQPILSLQPSLYELLKPRTWFSKSLDWVTAQASFPIIGSPTALQSLATNCKQENVTLNGAILAIIVTSFHTLREKYTGVRQDHVGYYIGISGLEFMARGGGGGGGFRLDMKFWDLARVLRREVDGTLKSLAMDVGVMWMEHIPFRKFLEVVKGRKDGSGIMSDLNVSNLGKYPFPLEYSIEGDESTSTSSSSVSIKGFHFYNTLPNVGPASCFFVGSTDRMHYSMTHKFEIEAGNELFNMIVGGIERIGSSSDFTTSEGNSVECERKVVGKLVLKYMNFCRKVLG